MCCSQVGHSDRWHLVADRWYVEAEKLVALFPDGTIRTATRRRQIVRAINIDTGHGLHVMPRGRAWTASGTADPGQAPCCVGIRAERTGYERRHGYGSPLYRHQRTALHERWSEAEVTPVPVLVPEWAVRPDGHVTCYALLSGVSVAQAAARTLRFAPDPTPAQATAAATA